MNQGYIFFSESLSCCRCGILLCPVLLCLFGGYLKEESEGHRDAAALCLFKNMGDKLVWRTERMKVTGEEGEAVEGSPQQLVHLVINAKH